MNANKKPVAVVIGTTSKWQSDGRNTKLVHGDNLDDSDLPVGVRWGVGGAIAQKFAQEGFFCRPHNPYQCKCVQTPRRNCRTRWREHDRRIGLGIK